MNKVKKIAILLSIIMLIGSIFVSKTYAALNCNVSLSKPADKVRYEESFSVYVSISNLQTTKGIIAIGGVLSYDINSLTLVDIEGENKWSDPMHNASNGKFSSFKNKLSTSNENVLKITFKVNEKGKAGNSAWIKIDNFEISDGDEEKNCGGSSVNITIGESNGGNSGGGSQGNNENQGGNNNQGGNQGNSGNQGGNNNQGENQGNNGNQSGSQNGNQNQGTNQGNRPNNSNPNQPVNSNQGNGTSSNNEGSTKPEENANNNQNSTITGIDTNRVNEENTVKDNNPVVKKTDYISKEEPVKLYKQSDNFLIICIVCTVGVIAIIGIGIFAKKKLKK